MAVVRVVIKNTLFFSTRNGVYYLGHCLRLAKFKIKQMTSLFTLFVLMPHFLIVFIENKYLPLSNRKSIIQIILIQRKMFVSFFFIICLSCSL